ncbi:hypothetical protein DF185_17165 [Marinifilum breve]|uniref:Cellobiose phosphorylase n=1 Tax=Marinifilum breve TaxID=2184082 RepID=A0A2V3ZUU5_9BACT|nr:hypothetical protein [Marinifilum breve]PXX98059.1 hypothetical protein DF185_17165 [Marinifilum breve]
MKKSNIYLGNTNLNCSGAEIKGEFVELNNEKFYKISNSDQMADFFMSIVSDSDHWMFISSNGSLSAGRKNRDNALFPYYTVDKIHDFKGITGSKTLFLVEKEEKTFLWEPFAKNLNEVYKIQRNLYKSIYGNKIIFEEVNLDLGIEFQYAWYNSEKFGFVRKSKVKNISGNKLNAEVLDGIQNIIPYGFDYAFQSEYSNLLDAYKKNELIPASGLGLFMLSSIPVDRAEPSESLKCTTVWSAGLQNKKILLSAKQEQNFIKGLNLETEVDVRATRGAYMLNSELELSTSESEEWMIVAEINQDSSAVSNLNEFIKNDTNLLIAIDEDIQLGTENLIQIVADADGLQSGKDDLCTARHFSNTMFNAMRGGIFIDSYNINSADLALFVKQSNSKIYSEFNSWLNELPKEISYNELLDKVSIVANSDLQRICLEYLPLTFSRRHGDPSRPWNQFSIETKNEDGSPKLNYQGNWRDIFQNWEALAWSFPEYLEGMISKFVNASTADGYNPYRITREGIDWECPDPEDPWAYIGYWGDHQIIYLQKLLELSNDFHPGKLDELLGKEIFVYANVPYRIKAYDQIVKNPQDTIGFDFDLNKEIKANYKEIGADAFLLKQGSEIYRVNLMEKILVTLLSKLSNFIPEAGIWLNTQRPEWNDANNALVGNGVSMVTLYYLRRFLKFWTEKLTQLSVEEISVSAEVKSLLDKVFKLFNEKSNLLNTGFTNKERKYFADILGLAGTEYREAIYTNSFSGERNSVKVADLVEFTSLAMSYMDQSIRVNKREDKLYHAYNLISISDEEISIRYLYEMLEGQVAVLSSGYLSAEESLEVLDALKASSLFREDQFSYILYPDRQLARFTEKNNISKEQVAKSALLQKLIEDKNTALVSADQSGSCHFNGNIRNTEVLNGILDGLNSEYKELVNADRDLVLNAYESMFDHQSFTGRSGTFYGYEGLGSIYWHMVSKLLLAAQENFFLATDENLSPELIGRLKEHYYEIKAGIGIYKSPDLYGAFPTDAYSHTPGNAGVKQPGMTGQVKEDFISRMGELGIRIDQGKIVFDLPLLNEKEVLENSEVFTYYDLQNAKQIIELDKGQLALTFCKVPVVFSNGSISEIKIIYKDGSSTLITGNVIDENISSSIFRREDSVRRIDYTMSKK